jgi:hypothetical protein
MRKLPLRIDSRRDFLKKGMLAAAGLYILPRHVLGGKGYTAPSDKVNVGAIGIGGKGEVDVDFLYGTGKAEFPVLCDVDDRRAANIRKKFPSAKYYKDYREMLDKEHKHLDAITIATPDHMHAVIGMAAMQLGKHVYIQKPLAHDIYETRMLTQGAARYKVVSQIGTGPVSWATLPKSIVLPTGRYGPRAFSGRIKRPMCRRSWIGISGWVRLLTGIM